MAGFAHYLVHGLHIADITVKTSSGDVTMANEGAVVVNKDSGAATAVTLPPNPDAHGIFKAVWVIDGKGDAATNNITVSAASGNINGAATYVISENYGAVLFIHNGTQWNVAGTYKANATVAAQTITDLTATNGTITNLTATNGTVTTATITNATVTNYRHGDVGALAAAGTVIANAAAITNSVTVVSGADDAKGVVLPAAVAGRVYEVYSSQAGNGLLIYPPVNGTINGGSANAAVTIEGKTWASFLATSNTNYAARYTANS